MLAVPLYVACAEQTLRDLKEVYEEQTAFGPVLFLYSEPIELNLERSPVLKITPLNDHPQQDWPDEIRRRVEESGAAFWGLATEVAMRFHGREAEGEPLRTEHWLIYLLCHQGGMLAWGAPVRTGRKLGPMRDLTGDARVQKMLAHLSTAFEGSGN